MLNVFIDSNIWLDLYHFSSNDIEEFSKLKDILNKEIILYMPVQVIYEIQRNRDSKINDAIKKFRDYKIQVPNLCKGYSEYATFNSLYVNTIKTYRNLLNRVEEDVAKRQLPVDKLTNEIYHLCLKIEDSNDIINKAEIRFKRGNPPGKNNSLGDAINWETLLINVPQKEDLFFISGDKDYQNPINDKEFNQFLSNEWKKKKESEIFYYSSLVAFLSDHKKDINLHSENEKESIIETLSNSGSFTQTHMLIGKLNKYEYFSDVQMNQLLRIAATNKQVQSIITDKDIKEFYLSIIKGKEDKISDDDDIQDIYLDLIF